MHVWDMVLPSVLLHFRSWGFPDLAQLAEAATGWNHGRRFWASCLAQRGSSSRTVLAVTECDKTRKSVCRQDSSSRAVSGSSSQTVLGWPWLWVSDVLRKWVCGMDSQLTQPPSNVSNKNNQWTAPWSILSHKSAWCGYDYEKYSETVRSKFLDVGWNKCWTYSSFD
jgi:hypothetical protein